MTYLSQHLPRARYHALTGARMSPDPTRLPPLTKRSGPREPRLPEPGPPEITVENAVAWLRSETATAIFGQMPLPVIQARTSTCLACPYRGQKRANPDEIGYCLVCGCGDSERGRLSRKITMRGVKKPKQCSWAE